MKSTKRQKEGKRRKKWNKKVKENKLGMKSFMKPGKLESRQRLDFSFVLILFFLRKK